jgi:hypothetical protein
MLGAAAVGAACCASPHVLAVPLGDDGGAEFVRSTTRDGLVALDTGTTIYRRADGHLFTAKRAGRNRVHS